MSYEVSNFNEEVIKRSYAIRILVDFWAEWCGPCKMLGPVIETLAKQNENIWELVKVNTETNQDIARKYNIQGIPNVKLFLDGDVRDEFTGALSAPMIEQWLKKAIPSPHIAQIEEASELYDKGEVDQAREILRVVLDREPQNERAMVMFARVYLNENPSYCLELLKPIEPGSEYYDSAMALLTIAELYQCLEKPEILPDHPIKANYIQAISYLKEGNHPLALENFIEVIRVNREYADEGARRGCISIFGILGESHPTTRQYRRAFSNALYA